MAAEYADPEESRQNTPTARDNAMSGAIMFDITRSIAT
jgi:hypothetical protein